jgi:mono/diheme cytochrome c family protein
MNRKRFLWMSLGASLAVFLWVGFSPVRRDVASLRFDQDAALLRLYQANPTPTPFRNPTATPSSQGGHGHDIFYVYCMPCHGDRGQGLTDEFRNRQYPPEDTNCWKSGCHGPRPYDNGFTLPTTVPVLIGPGALQRFPTAQNMYAFMRAAMPFNKPGSLSDEQYLELAAFLLEQNRFTAEGTQLNAATLQNIVLQPGAAPTASAVPSAATGGAGDNLSPLLLGVIVLLGLAAILYLVTRSRSGQSLH